MKRMRSNLASGCLFLFVSTLAVQVAEGAALGRWSFDNGVGSSDTIVNDSAGSNEQGTLVGVESLPSFVPGLDGTTSALAFDADDDHVEVLGPAAASHLTQVPGATIAAWIKVPEEGLGSGTKTIVFYSRNGSSTQGRAALEINFGKPQGLGRGIDGGSLQRHVMDYLLVPDTEYFVATTLDYTGDTVSVYLWDGIEWNSSTGDVDFGADGGLTPNTSSDFVRFGERPDGAQDFVGILDNVYVYNEVLDEMALQVLAGVIEGEGLPGDFNDDDRVDAADYTIWRNNAGTNIALPNDNGIGGTIGQDHYKLWKDNFGGGSGSAASGFQSATNVVPEPTSLFLVLIGVSVVCRRHRTIDRLKVTVAE
jgi:hypothetical protein